MRLLTTALACVAIALPAQAQSTADDAAIRATIGEYFRGHATADSVIMRRPFLPTAHIEGIRGDTLASWTLDQYVAFSRGTPAPDEATRRRRIDAISVNGTAAMAQATLEHGPTIFTDYFVLLKLNGEWKIANKVYSAARRTP